MTRARGPLSRAIAEREALRGAAVESGSERRRSSLRGSETRPRRGRGPARAQANDPDAERDLGPEADPESVARTILLDQLTGRARSRSELATKLRQRGVPDDIAASLLDRFTEVGLIDDAAFAREWIRQRRETRGLAGRALAQELRRKGVDTEVTQEALAAAADQDPDADLDAARTLVRRKLRSVRSLDEDKAVRRLVGMLARKGHGPGVAYRVVREELAVDLADPEHTGP